MVPEAAAACWASASSLSVLLAEAQTRWPASTNVKAHACPMPLEAPVTQIRRGVLFFMLLGSQDYGAHHHAMFGEHVMPSRERGSEPRVLRCLVRHAPLPIRPNTRRAHKVGWTCLTRSQMVAARFGREILPVKLGRAARRVGPLSEDVVQGVLHAVPTTLAEVGFRVHAVDEVGKFPTATVRTHHVVGSRNQPIGFPRVSPSSGLVV